jgi:hypothetical protein
MPAPAFHLQIEIVPGEGSYVVETLAAHQCAPETPASS